MGLVIVIVVGAVLGWLAAIVVERDDRVGAAVCALAGMVGSVVAAVLAGDVPLREGVSAAQLLWGVIGAVLAIVAINAAVVTRTGAKAGSV
jgi:uncharacterized membrane protein YeaQ/YmgE (transglycosylase-associated protein family)